MLQEQTDILKLKSLCISGTPMETGGHLSQPGTPLGAGSIHEPTPPPLEMMIFSPGMLMTAQNSVASHLF